MNGDKELDKIIDSQQDEKDQIIKDEEIVEMMKQRSLFVEELDELVTPGYNINEGDDGGKSSVVDLVHRVLCIKKMSDDLNKSIDKKSKKSLRLSVSPKTQSNVFGQIQSNENTN